MKKLIAVKHLVNIFELIIENLSSIVVYYYKRNCLIARDYV